MQGRSRAEANAGILIHSQTAKRLEKLDEFEYAKFAWVIDPEGNKVELWRPPAGRW
jgi:hypothetical protein